MPFGTPITDWIPSQIDYPGVVPKPSYPLPRPTNWQVVHTDPDVPENGGSAVVDPAGEARVEIKPIYMAGAGTGLLVRVRYPAASVPSTDPKVRVFGVDGNGRWQEVPDEDGDLLVELTIAEATDLKETISGTVYQNSVAKKFDGLNLLTLYVMVEIAVAGGGAANCVIEGRPY